MARILVIDDEREIREGLADFLREEGHEVTLAANGREGFDSLKRNPVDLVITDLIMPEQEGVETIRRIRKEMPDVKIIAMSGGGRVAPGGYLTVAAKMGASRVFAKPLNLENLFAAVRELLA